MWAKTKAWMKKDSPLSGAVADILDNMDKRFGKPKLMSPKGEKCGWSKVNTSTGKIPLTVNHIDGNHRNNRPENLELICPSCHSLTPNYGALNKGNGRREGRRVWRNKNKNGVVDGT